MRLQTVALEMSLKPFKSPQIECVDGVLRRLFLQWEPLCRHAGSVSVMLWTADGSEILDYRGNMAEEFEWAYWVGGANPRTKNPNDPDGVGLHSRPYRYMDNPPRFSYGWLRSLTDAIRRVGREVLAKPIHVGATFDPGPEFAKSAFKYERHPEACPGGTMGKSSFMCCYATLEPDEVAYAGFPDGIPAGTSIGTFLGRQSQCFLADLGFDYIWLSNGFGFGLETWALRGAVFDGKSFSADRCDEVREKILGFWRDFRTECPDFRVETRGTNLSTGMDLASDAVPLRDIYAGGFGMEPPPNSPWAALNGDFGLELVGWMSHIAEIPRETFPFRFYTHDPWWNNSPWLDRYGREPHDIYLPLSVARLGRNGMVTPPTTVNFLTVDDSWGEMPDIVPREVIPHVVEALETAPDRVGPLLWVYPFEEYHRMTYGEPSRIDEVFFGDWFMRGAVNNGLPLNSVISTTNADTVLRANPDAFHESVLVTPVPQAGSAWEDRLMNTWQSGGKVLLYGPLRYASDRLCDELGVTRDVPIEGDLALALSMVPDHITDGQDTLKHPALLSGGGITAVSAAASVPGRTLLATVRQGDQTRLAALTRSVSDWSGGRVTWVRGTVSCDPARTSGHLLVPFPSAVSFPGERLMRYALSSFGIDLRVDRIDTKAADDGPVPPCPLTCISRHRNAFFFSGYTPRTTVRVHMRLPQGAPLFHGWETVLSEGCATYAPPRAWRRECRVFVEQEQGEAGCRTACVGSRFDQRHCLIVSGLQNATLRFFHVPGTEGRVEFLRDPVSPYVRGDFLTAERKTDHLGDYLQVKRVSGTVAISW